LNRVVWQKFTDVSEVLAASIIIGLIMEAASASDTSVNFYQTTWRNNPEDSHLHTTQQTEHGSNNHNRK
jgi:mannose-6-phosphate isomerase class I